MISDVLSLREATYRYRGGGGVGPITVAVPEGRVVALVGANGAGKSTSLHMLAGIHRLIEGDWSSQWGSRRATLQHLGFAPDDIESGDGLTVAQTLHFWAAQWLGRGPARAAAADIMERLGLADRADEPLDAQSFGNRRRVALASALAHRPAVALLDEPTAGLDPDGVETLTAVIRERSQRGLTCVVASNDPHFVAATADTVILIDAGQTGRSMSGTDFGRATAPRRCLTVQVLLPQRPPALAGVTWTATGGGVWQGSLDARADLGAVVTALEAIAGIASLQVTSVTDVAQEVPA